MIQIKHFTSDRDGNAPNWKKVEDWLNTIFYKNVKVDEILKETSKLRPPGILQVKMYPTGPVHIMILIVEDGFPQEKPV